MKRLHRVCWIVLCVVVTGLATAAEPVTRPAPAVGGAALAADDARHADLVRRIDRALGSAARFLEQKQSPDGLWRSNVYGAFKEGDALTPLVMRALTALPDGSNDRPVVTRGMAAMADLIDPPAKEGDSSKDDKAAPLKLTYSVYSAANALVAMRQFGEQAERSKDVWANEYLKEFHRVRDLWVAVLLARQLTEERGWTRDDPEFGGWSYAPDPVRKPAPGEPLGTLAQPNLSATVFAVEGLHAAGCAADGLDFIDKAITFIQRCQNYQHDANLRQPEFDDGGFFFIHDDPVRNKAGRVGIDRSGCERFASYGSATADGLRGLLVRDWTRGTPQATVAQQWLERNFSAASATHSGRFPQDRELMRDSLTYYYWCSLAAAFEAAHVRSFGEQSEPFEWAEVVARQLLERQQADGSWRNEAVEVREDDPLVATPLAVMTLVICRRVLLADGPAK